jgi:GH25 family lysozyme M1 (1,4-beta-N-acetylmuramidase)
VRPLTPRFLAVTALIGAVVTLTAATAQAKLVPGIDTSHYQHAPSLDWAKVKGDGVAFAFLKATEGTTFTDPYFASDWSSTRSNGIYRGAYHFARPSVGSADNQAAYFASVIGPQTGRGTLPPVLDLESTGGLSRSRLITWTSNFLKATEQLTGRVPIVYVSPAFWEDHLANSTAFHHYPLWIAHYGVSSPRVPGGWPAWTFWQTNSTGRVQGISGRVDSDLFNGDLTGLKKLALAYDPQPALLTLAPSNPAPKTGQTVTFTGTLIDRTGAAIAGRTVTVSTLAADGVTWTPVGTATTTSTGAYSLPLVVTAPGSYRASFAGDGDFKPAVSPAVAVTLTPRLTRMSLATSATSALAGQPVTFSGVLRPIKAMAGKTLLVTVLPEGSTTWVSVGTTTTDSAGAYDAAMTVLRSGTYKVTYIGDPAYAGTEALKPLAVALNPNAITFKVGNNAPYAGHQVRLSGTLLSGTTPVAGRSVVISKLAAGDTVFRAVATVRTDASGRFSTRTAVDSAATYRAVFVADELYQSATSVSQDVTITPPGATHLSAKHRKAKVRPGKASVLQGKLADATGAGVGARRVEIWQRLVGTKKWVEVGSTVTGRYGVWKTSVEPTADSWYRARFSGGTMYRPATSRWFCRLLA